MSAYLRRCIPLRKLFIASRQISRFSSFNKNCNFLKGTPGSAYGKNLVFGRSLATVAPQYENGEEQVRAAESLPADEFIDQTLLKIDSEARRFGLISERDVEAVFNRIKKSGAVSSIQSLYLIRCCGSLLSSEIPAQRIVLANDIWSKLQELGIPMDVSHYNALLKCYLENEHQFSSSEFLASMEHKGITPNRVTYQCVIEKYCQNGDLNAASAILEHMKEKNFAINESTFNSLVLGHARAKDMQGAVNMLQVMRNSNLEPSSETYATLACGYAENGDMEGFSNVLREVEEKELYFSVKSYLNIVQSLAHSGNSEHMNKILTELDVQRHKPEATNAALTLIGKGHHDVGYKIIEILVAATGFKKTFYYFVKALAVKGLPFDQVNSYCQDILEKGTYEYIYEDAVKASLLYGKTDVALELFKEMKKIGRPLRCHYFWPVFATHARDGNLEGIWSTLNLMSDMGILADNDTYVDFVFPHVPTSDLHAVLSKVEEVGQSRNVAVDALFFHFCFTDQMTAAAEIYEEYKPQYNLHGILNVLANGKLEDIESILKLLKQLREEIPDYELRDDVYGLFLDRLLYHCRDVPLLDRFIREYHAQDIRLSSKFVEIICTRLKEFAPELLRRVRALEMNVIRDLYRDAHYISPRDMNVVQLEKRLADIKGTDENARPVLRHLFSQYCRDKNLDRALEIKAEMDAMNFTYSPATYALLINLYVAHDKLEEAMMCKKEIDELYPHFKLDAARGLDYVALMIKSGKTDEAFEIVKNEAKDWLPPRYTDLLVSSVRNVLHAAADTGIVEITQKLFQLLVMDLNFASMHYTILEPLIKVHLIRNEVDIALEEYRKCVVNYKLFPSRNYLFKKFIALKDHERLQKVVDISTTFGNDIALHDLAAAFIEEGCVQEARKVLQTLGTKADTKQLSVICHRFFKENRILNLQQFIGITKDLNHVDRDQLYRHLLNLHVQQNDYQSGLEIWNAMQEENVQASALTLQTLADLLKKNDQPIPFIVPGTLEQPQNENTELLKYLDEKDEVEIVGLLKRMKKGEVHALTTNVFSKIVDVLVEKKALREIVDIVQVMSCILSKPVAILRPVANKYGAIGDVDSLKLLHDCVPDFAHKYMNFRVNFFDAYIVSGQPEKLLDELEKNMNTSKKMFSINGFLKLFESFPALHDRAVKLTDMYAEQEDFDMPKAVLWSYYFIQENYDEAAKVYKKYSAAVMKMEYLLTRIVKAVRSTQNEVLGRNIIEIANESMKTSVKSRAYSSLLDVLVNKEKLEEAVALIEEANSKGVPTEQILHPTLVNLKRSLTEKNMPVPFGIPLEGEDSTSSDSD